MDNTENTTDQLRDKAGEAAENLKNLGGQVRDAAAENFGNYRQQANEYISEGRETAREWERSLETFVQEKPLQAVLVAAGVGMLLGLIWKRS